jgi:hypothetical protein
MYLKDDRAVMLHDHSIRYYNYIYRECILIFPCGSEWNREEQISQCELIYFCELIYLPENTALSLMHNIIHFVADLRVGLVK